MTNKDSVTPYAVLIFIQNLVGVINSNHSGLKSPFYFIDNTQPSLRCTSVDLDIAHQMEPHNIDMPESSEACP